MPYVTADVDLDEFDTRNLVEELISRIHNNKLKRLSDEKKEELREELKGLSDALGGTQPGIEVKSLDDQLKMDHLCLVWNKYSSSDIISRLPE